MPTRGRRGIASTPSTRPGRAPVSCPSICRSSIPIPENDHWWGTGFTEWTNVTTARPVYRGHHQPKLPTDLGFYDLRLPAAVELQAALAEAAGIDGFMYYHYWFAGQQLLAEPIMARLEGDLPLPFCLMWANENWTRRWDGRDTDVLIGQHYDEVPATSFLDDVLPILRDPRYLRIDGRAVLAVYRPGQIPDLPDVVERGARSRDRTASASSACSPWTSRRSSTASRASRPRRGSTARSASRRTTAAGPGCRGIASSRRRPSPGTS